MTTNPHCDETDAEALEALVEAMFTLSFVLIPAYGVGAKTVLKPSISATAYAIGNGVSLRIYRAFAWELAEFANAVMPEGLVADDMPGGEVTRRMLDGEEIEGASHLANLECDAFHDAAFDGNLAGAVAVVDAVYQKLQDMSLSDEESLNGVASFLSMLILDLGIVGTAEVAPGTTKRAVGYDYPERLREPGEGA